MSHYIFYLHTNSPNKSSAPQIRTGRRPGPSGHKACVVINLEFGDSTGEERLCEVRQYPFAPPFESA